MLSEQDKSLLLLLDRSKDRGDGWRHCATWAWNLLQRFESPELLEFDHDHRGVRMTPVATAIVNYALK